eukprot:TRINITY_DN4042_c0_g1_i1.p1 TRINITY_DN4042_c0_g1~~TRINITY_DN4042_c0_g1_i1.p1  ORF type:complete len:494 (-),score=104.88 TRINITY_DN4042_c0_g1_i1:47-1528(-)
MISSPPATTFEWIVQWFKFVVVWVFPSFFSNVIFPAKPLEEKNFVNSSPDDEAGETTVDTPSEIPDASPDVSPDDSSEDDDYPDSSESEDDGNSFPSLEEAARAIDLEEAFVRQRSEPKIEVFSSGVEMSNLEESDPACGVLSILPDEVKLNILKFLSPPSIARVARVNSFWNHWTQQSIFWQYQCGQAFGIKILPEEYDTWKQLFYDYTIPLEQNENYQRCCYGYLGEHRAVIKLGGKPSGTFLFRSSSVQPNAITISYVNDDGSVLHRRMHKIAEGYTFNLPSYKQCGSEEDFYYRNYYQLISQNSHWLKKPLLSECDSLDLTERKKIEIFCKDNQGPPSSSLIRSIATALRKNLTPARELAIHANVYYGFRIGYTDLITLIESLHQNDSIVTLSLHHMHLNEVVCQALSRLLTENRNLTQVVLKHCGTDDNTVLPLIEGLNRPNSLKNFVLNEKSWPNSDFDKIRAADFEYVCLPWKCVKLNRMSLASPK